MAVWFRRSICRRMATSTYEKTAGKTHGASDDGFTRTGVKQAGLDGYESPSCLPLPEVLEGFCKHLRARRTHRSYRGMRSRLRVFFGPITPALAINSSGPESGSSRCEPRRDRYVGHHVTAKHLEGITPVMIERFIAQRLESGDWKAPKTANSLRQVLHQLFEYAIKHHGFQSPDPRHPNPAKCVDQIPEAAPTIRSLTTEQIVEQLQAVRHDPVLHAAVAIFIYAGLRRSEVCWLSREDVDLEKRLIRIEAKARGLEKWQPKTRRNRAVPISRTLAGILCDYFTPGWSPWYLPSPRGKRWDPDNLSKRLRNLKQQAGLPWTCLDFRHTFGSQLAQKGLSLYKISALMGNSPEICRRHYAAIIPEVMHEEVEFSDPGTEDCDASETKSLLQSLLARLEELGCEPRRHGSLRESSVKNPEASCEPHSSRYLARKFAARKAAANERGEEGQTAFSSEERRLS